MDKDNIWYGMTMLGVGVQSIYDLTNADELEDGESKDAYKELVEKYPDIKNKAIDLLTHYILHYIIYGII